MPRIDFYVLPDQAPDGRALLACRLGEKAYLQGHSVYIHAESAEQARALDDLLWTYKQNSFVPHTLCPLSPDDGSPVRIGWGDSAGAAADVLVNMTHAVLAFYAGYDRVVELVDQNPDTLAKSRERFRVYREQGHAPSSHKL